MEGHAEAGLSQLCEGRALTEPRPGATGNRSLVTSTSAPATGAALGPARGGGAEHTWRCQASEINMDIE